MFSKALKVTSERIAALMIPADKTPNRNRSQGFLIKFPHQDKSRKIQDKTD